MKIGELTAAIEKRFPPVYAEEWDNVGLLVGDAGEEVTKVFLALDATEDAIKEAKAFGAQLLLTHHPMIFRSMKRVTADHFIGKKILELAKSGIACYAMHTNFDVMGMADAMAERLQLTDSEVLMAAPQVSADIYGSEQAQGIGRVGNLTEKMTLREYAQFVKERLQMPFVTVSGDQAQSLHRVAVSPGSGRSMIGYALQAKADVLVTGDIGHHEALDAREQGLCIIDAGHYGTEKIFMEVMQQWLERECPQLTCRSAALREPFFVV